MEREYERILELMKQRRDLENKVFEEAKAHVSEVANNVQPAMATSGMAQKELDSFNEMHKEDVAKYNEFYSLLSKKVADKIDALPMNGMASFAELTRQTIMYDMEHEDSRLFKIFNNVVKNIESKDYYLDYSKYEGMDAGLPYNFEFVKASGSNPSQEELNYVELSNMDNLVVKRMVELFDKLPMGVPSKTVFDVPVETPNTFYKLLKSNIIEILDIDMQYLMKCIYDCLKYKEYYLDYSKLSNNNDYDWYIKNKPELVFVKVNDPKKNYDNAQSEAVSGLQKSVEEFKKLNDELGINNNSQNNGQF